MMPSCPPVSLHLAHASLAPPDDGSSALMEEIDVTDESPNVSAYGHGRPVFRVPRAPVGVPPTTNLPFAIWTRRPGTPYVGCDRRPTGARLPATRMGGLRMHTVTSMQPRGLESRF